MTESEWHKSNDGDAMLAVVSHRLSARKWNLIDCGLIRRVWDLLPESPFRDAVRFRESHPGDGLSPADHDLWTRRLLDAEAAAVAAAEDRQRAVVASCDPDADDSAFRESADRRMNPAVPLYRAASRQARGAIDSAGQAVRAAAAAVRLLFTNPDPIRANAVRGQVAEAVVRQATAGGVSALALEFLAKADELADRGQVKNPRLRQAEAEETVHRLTESSGNRLDGLPEQKERAVRHAVAGILREQLGNPFRPYRFEPRWRTDAVLGLARAIDEERAVERYPILLDTLLDADCDEEVILRHVRGTELYESNPQHAVGCWVTDLILEKEESLFTLPPLKNTKSASGPGSQLGLVPRNDVV